jgi:predicted TIM-barrel fold metal-dependent hydrolase
LQTAGACVEAIEYAHDGIGPERVIFGSDFPFFEVSDEIAKVRTAEIPKTAQDRILGENAEKLLKLV